MKSQGTSKAGEMNWVDEIKICNHDWVVRLIKLGQAEIPKIGFYVFDNPYIYKIVEKAIQQAIAQERERIVKSLRMEKLYNPKPSFLQDTQLPYEIYEDYDERKRFIYTDKNKKYDYNQAVDEFNKKLDELLK